MALLPGNQGEQTCSFKNLAVLNRPFSPLLDGAWTGRLVHLSGLDVIGSTAGSLARLIQDREAELWEGKRMVAQAEQEEVSHLRRPENKTTILLSFRSKLET